jgi:hypothetical protein
MTDAQVTAGPVPAGRGTIERGQAGVGSSIGGGLRLDPEAARTVLGRIREIGDDLAADLRRTREYPRPVIAGDEVSAAVATAALRTTAERERLEGRAITELTELITKVDRHVDGVQRADRVAAAAIGGRY